MSYELCVMRNVMIVLEWETIFHHFKLFFLSVFLQFLPSCNPTLFIYFINFASLKAYNKFNIQALHKYNYSVRNPTRFLSLVSVQII